MSQLRACGLVASVEMALAGYPYKMPYKHFLRRFDPRATKTRCSEPNAAELPDTIAALVAKLLPNHTAQVLFGATMVCYYINFHGSGPLE